VDVSRTVRFGLNRASFRGFYRNCNFGRRWQKMYLMWGSAFFWCLDYFVMGEVRSARKSVPNPGVQILSEPLPGV